MGTIWESIYRMSFLSVAQKLGKRRKADTGVAEGPLQSASTTICCRKVGLQDSLTTLIDKREDGGVRHPEKAGRPDTPVQRKPAWIRVKAPGSRGYAGTASIVRENRLHTVCEEASCPNIGECWEKRHATMMIMGDTCTRAWPSAM